jgi:hypothetical protein
MTRRQKRKREGLMSKNEKFIEDLFKTCETREQFIAIVNYGMTFLIEHKHLLITVLIRQAIRQTNDGKPDDIAFELSHLFNDLQLGFKEES